MSNAVQLEFNGVPHASQDAPDRNLRLELIFEAAFLRAFSTFEECIEAIFLHYGSGQRSLNNFSANTRIQNCTDAELRKIVKADGKYIDWSAPKAVHDRAKRFFSDGEPFSTTYMAASEALNRAEKIRNRIAHDSLEAKAAFNAVLIAHFGAPRVFEMVPGQYLRTRTKKRPYVHVGARYISDMADVVEALVART